MKLSKQMLRRVCVMLVVAATGFSVSYQANADIVEVTVTNNAPAGGVYLTPVWVGFHNGSFDTYDGGAASSIQLSRLAEDGNTGPVSQTFAANGTLVSTGVSQTGTRQQATIPGLVAPGQTVSFSFDVDIAAGGANQFFSYASMVLPSNDYYIANGNPTGIDLSSLSGSFGDSISFDVFQVNDAGTEINDFETSAGNGLFPELGLPAGQSGPNEGADEFGVNQNVNDAFGDFANTPGGADFSALDFNNAGLYPNGIATFTITTAVPEPSSLAFGAIVCVGMVARRRRLA